MYRIFFLLLSVVVLINNTINAQSDMLDPYRHYLDEEVMMNKIVVAFTPQVTMAEKQAILEQNRLEWAWDVPNPAVSYVRLPNAAKDYNALHEILETLEESDDVLYASPIIKSSGGSGYATMNSFFMKFKRGVEVPASWLEYFSSYGNSIQPYAPVPNCYLVTVNKDMRYNALEMSVIFGPLLNLDYAEPNYLFNPIVTTNDQYYSRQWAHKNDSSTVFQGNITGVENADMDVDSAWTITMGDSNIVIGILDSGIDTLHADLFGNLLPGYDATGGGSKGYPNTDKSSNAHGTACAGIVAAVANNNIGIAGVAPNCKVFPVKVFYYIDTVLAGAPFNDIPYSTSQWMGDAISWAWQTGNADILSNSWGLDDIFLSLLPGNPATVDSVIALAAEFGRGGKGLPMLFSSGNADTRPIWPSKLSTTIAVNASTMCDQRKFNGSCDGETWTGCWGADLDIAAPGVKIVTCDMTGSLGYSAGVNPDYTFTFNGTSAACPNAAGVMALMLSVNPDLDYDAVRWLISNSADKVGGYNYSQYKFAGAWSNEMGYGRVNAYQAVLAALNYNGSHPDLTTVFEIAPKESLFSVMPNPYSGDELILSFNNVLGENITAKVMSAQGQVLEQHSLGNITGPFKLEHNTRLPQGMYIIQLTIGGQTSYQKVLVSR